MNQTKLNYTIIQPGYLMETEGSGNIRTDEANMRIDGQISIQNVADTLKEILDKPNTYGKNIPILDGDTPIAEAVLGQ